MKGVAAERIPFAGSSPFFLCTRTSPISYAFVRPRAMKMGDVPAVVWRLGWTADDHAQLSIANHAACFNRAPTTGRTISFIAALNFAGSSTNGSCPEFSNQTSVFDGAVSASK